MEQRKPKMGEAVVYVDPVGQAHPALITAVWGVNCINVVFVSRDEAKRDNYGQQIERQTSCNHQRQHEAHGNYWRYQEDEAKSTEVPA